MSNQSRFYIDNDCIEPLLDGQDLEDVFGFRVLPFYCNNCGVHFKDLTALYQHAASPACANNAIQVIMTNVTRWLRKRYARARTDRCTDDWSRSSIAYEDKAGKIATKTECEFLNTP